jgi:hypothetical protein
VCDNGDVADVLHEKRKMNEWKKRIWGVKLSFVGMAFFLEKKNYW